MNHNLVGPIVRINPHEIHVADPTWLDTLYTGPGPVCKPMKSTFERPVLTLLKTRDKYAPAAHMSGVPEGSTSDMSWLCRGKPSLSVRLWLTY